jgi:hypothetical protein
VVSHVIRPSSQHICQFGTTNLGSPAAESTAKSPNFFAIRYLRWQALALAQALRNTAKSRGALPFLAAATIIPH